MNRLKGKVAIISGGATGMGGAASRLFAAEGASVGAVAGHLLAAGRGRIATIAGPQDMAAGVSRLAGYREALERAGLSYANRRRLEIARALAADPKLADRDEPAAGLRRQEKLKLADLLRSLRAEHLTILLVEHDMEFVMSLVDRIVVLDFGSKLCEGEPAAIRSDARVQEAYLGGVA